MQETRDPWVRKIPWRREWQSTPVFLPGECHGQRSLVGYIQPMGLQRVGHNWANTHICVYIFHLNIGNSTFVGEKWPRILFLKFYNYYKSPEELLKMHRLISKQVWEGNCWSVRILSFYQASKSIAAFEGLRFCIAENWFHYRFQQSFFFFFDSNFFSTFTYSFNKVFTECVLWGRQFTRRIKKIWSQLLRKRRATFPGGAEKAEAVALVQRLGDKRSLRSGEDEHPHSGGRDSKTGWKALSRNCRFHQIAKTHGVYGGHQTEGQAKTNGSGSPAWQPTPVFLPGEPWTEEPGGL